MWSCAAVAHLLQGDVLYLLDSGSRSRVEGAVVWVAIKSNSRGWNKKSAISAAQTVSNLWAQRGQTHFQEPINIECGINTGPLDYEMEGVWMSLVVCVGLPRSALEYVVKGCKALQSGPN